MSKVDRPNNSFMKRRLYIKQKVKEYRLQRLCE